MHVACYLPWRHAPLPTAAPLCACHRLCVSVPAPAVQVAAADPNARYALGSVLNHVLLHQTIIGEEALLQLAKIGETPDLVVSGVRPPAMPNKVVVFSPARPNKVLVFFGGWVVSSQCLACTTDTTALGLLVGAPRVAVLCSTCSVQTNIDSWAEQTSIRV